MLATKQTEYTERGQDCREGAAAATQFLTTDGHGFTRIKPSRWAYSDLRVRALRGEKGFSEMSDFGIVHCNERGDKELWGFLPAERRRRTQTIRT